MTNIPNVTIAFEGREASKETGLNRVSTCRICRDIDGEEVRIAITDVTGKETTIWLDTNSFRKAIKSLGLDGFSRLS